MVEMPWQIVASFIALFAVNLILQHLRKRNCEELIEAEKRLQHQFTMRVYREGFHTGLTDGKSLKALTQKKDDHDHA